MRIVIQRVVEASVRVDDEVKGKINNGLVLLIGVASNDTEEDVNYLVNKVINMRIFDDGDGKMNESLIDKGYSVLSISQFTLLAKTKKGNRPSFTDAAAPQHALELYNSFNNKIVLNQINLEKGIFGAHMQISLINEGPVTIVIDSKDK